MSIFNSLGSNHTLFSALRILCAIGGARSRRRLEEYLETRYGGRVILTYKGREALRIALDSIPEKASVAINGYTCWAVYQAIQESGHRCHYLDISESSLNFSAEALRDALAVEPSIKAVIIQNTLGIPCDIENIAALCKERGIVLIEDLAHSIGTTYASGADAGTIGDFVILSFSQDKVIDAVAGGALIIRDSTSHDAIGVLPRRKVAYRQQLKDRFYPVFTYAIRSTHVLGLGPFIHRALKSLDLLSRPLEDNQTSAVHELPGWYCATIARAYAALASTTEHRREIARIYREKIDKRMQLSHDMKLLDHSTNLRFPILHNERDRLIDHLRSHHIYVGDIWYDAPIGPKRFLHRTDYRGECPRSEQVSATMMNLPTHIHVSPAQAEKIAALVNERPRPEGNGMYHVKPIRDEVVWERFLSDLKPHSFLHSWKWGQHFEGTGSQIFRVGVYDGQDVVGVALFIKIRARRGMFLLCPHGPIIAPGCNEENALAALSHYATDVGREERCDFIRFCPLSPKDDAGKQMYRRLGFHDAPIHMHPELSWILDITKPEDVLLKEMRKTTRYLIKKMEKEGVEIVQSTDPADMEKFWSVYEETFERQQFTPFSQKYLKTEFELFRKDDQAVFFFGKYKGEVVAVAIIIFYNDQAFYHHSGSLGGGGSNVSYLLQWRVIQEAKRRGCTLYNFWGIAPADNPKHAWTGLSLFKKGFGGYAEAYLHAQDKPLTAKYALNYAIETVRRIRRHL